MDKAWQKFDDSLKLHIANVQEAGRSINVPEYLLRDHDLSKWDSIEFDAYAKNFHGGGDPKNFPLAWLHHVHNNPHHWQHWIFPDGWTMDGSAMDGACIEMPDEYALEMIADWHGASKSYTGNWNISGWLSKNAPKLTLHSKTTQLIHDVMIDLGYVLTDNCPWSFAWLQQDRQPIGN